MKGIVNYFKKTKEEMNHVTWPTWQEAAALSALVIVISLVIAYFMGAFDALFAMLLGKVI